jgi:hypothetical protein
MSSRVPVPKFACAVACASGFVQSMDDNAPWT